ncbi:MAG: post-transcriptional regulator [Bacillaceae bacterium]
MNEEVKQQLKMYRHQVQEVLESKVEELKFLGYEHTSVDEVWECLSETKWKRLKEEPKFYQIIDDILSLSAGAFMLYLSKKANSSTDLFF